MSDEKVAPWLLGTGMDADMSGDGGAMKPKDLANNNRFWMPKGSDRTIIFLSSGPDASTIWEPIKSPRKLEKLVHLLRAYWKTLSDL